MQFSLDSHACVLLETTHRERIRIVLRRKHKRQQQQQLLGTRRLLTIHHAQTLASTQLKARCK